MHTNELVQIPWAQVYGAGSSQAASTKTGQCLSGAKPVAGLSDHASSMQMNNPRAIHSARSLGVLPQV